jgi:large subunit ribosomal protein L13
MLGARITKHTPPAQVPSQWHVVDAEGQRLGHLAVSVAGMLQGKNKALYSRHWMNGDFVVVVNAAKIEVSGNKLSQKMYYRHSGYVGNLRKSNLETEMDKNPGRVIERAVKGMLPRNRLGRKMLGRLHVYESEEHPHAAQVNVGTGKPRTTPRKSPSERRKAASVRRAAEKAGATAVAAATEEQVEATTAAAEEAAAEVEETAAAEVAEAPAETEAAEEEATAEVAEEASEAEKAPAADTEEPEVAVEEQPVAEVEEEQPEASVEAAEEPEEAEAETADDSEKSEDKG